MNPAAELVLARIALIAPLLDEAMAGAILQAETRARGFDHARFPHTRPLSIRQDVRLELEEQPLPDGWEVAGDPRKMGQLLLKDHRTGMVVRFLKSPYGSQPDGIPHAGRNPARQQAWSGQALPVALPGLGVPGSLTDRSSLAGQTFLLIWAYLDPTDREAGFVLRIVHTRAPGAIGKSTPCDLDLVIPRGGMIQEENLRFVASDEDEELFSFDLPEEVEEASNE